MQDANQFNTRSCSLLSRTVFVCFACFSFACFSLCGCNVQESGPDLHQVTGSVTYDGEPLKAGRITFTPDSSQGNAGPTGYAVIRDGKYDTAVQGGKGVVAGAVKVLISGESRALPNEAAQDVEDEEMIDFPEPLFENYQSTAQITESKEPNQLDFDVPKQ